MTIPSHNPGDLVRLKTGGPAMLVDYVNESSGIIHCWWFSPSKAGEQHQLNRATFPCEDTIRVDSPATPPQR